MTVQMMNVSGSAVQRLSGSQERRNSLPANLSGPCNAKLDGCEPGERRFREVGKLSALFADVAGNRSVGSISLGHGDDSHRFTGL